MKALTFILAAFLLYSCQSTPQTVSEAAKSPQTAAIAQSVDTALAAFHADVVNVRGAANGIKEAADRIIADRQAAVAAGPPPSGKPPTPVDAPVSAKDWVTIALGGVAGLLGLNQVRNQKYLKQVQPQLVKTDSTSPKAVDSAPTSHPLR